jgi:hypothetical protein
MSVVFATHLERPDLRESEELWREWPEFMLHDDVAATRWGRLFDRFGAFQFWGLDRASGALVAKCNCVPVALDPDDLPDGGWSEALRAAMDDDRPPTLVCALQIQVARARRGEGLSTLALLEMRRIAKEHGFSDLVAPVRPSLKSSYPLVPAERYAAWVREDGLPFDPWLRVHARAGARLVRVCHESMHVPGTIEEWEGWAGMAFPETGTYVVPGALVPVAIDREADRGLYVEPNVWMHHRLDRGL